MKLFLACLAMVMALVSACGETSKKAAEGKKSPVESPLINTGTGDATLPIDPNLAGDQYLDPNGRTWYNPSRSGSLADALGSSAVPVDPNAGSGNALCALLPTVASQLGIAADQLAIVQGLCTTMGGNLSGMSGLQSLLGMVPGLSNLNLGGLNIPGLTNPSTTPIPTVGVCTALGNGFRAPQTMEVSAAATGLKTKWPALATACVWVQDASSYSCYSMSSNASIPTQVSEFHEIMCVK